MSALWGAALPIADDAAVRAWVAQRAGLDLHVLQMLDVARVLPADIECPAWATCGGRSWAQSGHRLLAPLVDARGRLRSLRARQLGAGTLKELVPTGHEVSGLVAACPMARAVLGLRSSEHQVSSPLQRNGLVIVEGTPAWWGWLSAFSDADEQTPAVIGIASGGWTHSHADAVARVAGDRPLRILVDTDPDDGGERLAARVIASFEAHALCGRVVLERRSRSRS